MIGTTLSHYRITEKLGAGGMGIVYRAEDTNLNRQVAIKVLPDIFSGDPERMARFEREAKLLASLNHPNIAAIYGLEQAEGRRFLVLELVEGETLAQRIAKGPLPVDEALDVCHQIAEGLEAAHEKGIIHRDLKPANVKITPEGKVKVLDFGLARAFQGETATADASHSPTLTDQMTRPGVILGTAAYMSPEQAKGGVVDKRADIWAFGCILFECLTGRRAFEGDTITETLASILKGTPNWNAIPPAAPAAVTELLCRCLEKESRERIHDIGDVRIEIAHETGAARKYPRQESVRVRRGLRSNALLFLVALIGGAAIASIFLSNRPESKHVARFDVILLPSTTFPDRGGICVSPDGRRIVYVAEQNNNRQLFARDIDSFDISLIEGTEDAHTPTFSPDGGWVAFFAQGRLKKVSMSGGTPQNICEVPTLTFSMGIDWSSEGYIIFQPGIHYGLFRVSANGGSPESISGIDGLAASPQCLPGGDKLLFLIMKEKQQRLGILSLKTGGQKLLPGPFDSNWVRYLTTGHLVYLQSGRMMALPFDLARETPIGNPSLVLDGIYEPQWGVPLIAVSGGGLLAYVPGGREQSKMVFVDRAGAAIWQSEESANYSYPRFSPKGDKIAVSTSTGIQIYDAARRRVESILPTPKGGFDPVWSQDGTKIAFSSMGSDSYVIFQQSVEGGEDARLLLNSQHNLFAYSRSGDGRLFAYYEVHPKTGRDIWILPENGKPEQVLATEFNERSPSLSPDGRWIAYVSDELGKDEVYVRPCTGHAGKWLISKDGGSEPLWSADGREIFYRKAYQMWSVPVETTPTFKHGGPVLLFEGRYDLARNPSGSRHYDVSPDGKRFVMVSHQLDETRFFHIVQNWFEELKRLVPTGK